ncbi:MAG: hypothetical protein LBI57_05310 [Helicobacteraceae bacterium]|jgi:hypothetical protein|nr:hypothetical protein [Helicobacteraceae bacterium]
MNNKEILDELYKIGNLPSDRDDIGDYPVDEFEKLIKQIQLPLDFETVVKLINLSPPIDVGCFGIEMTMVHLIEKYENIINDFEKIVKSSKEGEIKNILKERMKNKLKK